MSPRFLLGWENVLCVAEVVNRSLKADCTDFRYFGIFDSDLRVPRMFSYGVPLGGNNTEMKGHLFSQGEGAHRHFFDRNAPTRTNFNYPKK